MFTRVWSSEFFVVLSEIRFILLWNIIFYSLASSFFRHNDDQILKNFLMFFKNIYFFQSFERLTLQTKLLLTIFIPVMIILYENYKSCWAREINNFFVEYL